MERKKSQSLIVCHGHSRPIVDLSYSPVTEDGYFLISASKDGKPMLRNGETGDWIGTFEGHKGAVWGACLDFPALRAATASADFTARVWNALSGDELHSFEHKHIVRTVDFSQNTKLLLTGGAEKKLRVFDLENLNSDPMVMEGSPGCIIQCAVFHNNDKLIISSSRDDPGVRIWDIRTCSIVRTLETKQPCTSVEISRDGRYITTADKNDVKFWDANGFELIKQITFPSAVESASFFPKLKQFVIGGSDMWVHLVDFDSGQELECHKGHHGPVHCVRFDPKGESYASGSEDGTIRIWHTSGSNADSGSNQINSSIPLRVGVEEVKQKIEGFAINGTKPN